VGRAALTSSAPPRRLPGGAWRTLLRHALTLVDEIARQGTPDLLWTLGGGTALMLRYRHRRSRDIDIFVPDPQALGFVSPRLSSIAESVCSDYVEGTQFVKLVRPEGDIDFVAAPNLTTSPFETWRIERRTVRVETAVEIVAKKMWHRADTVTARDLFDLSLVIEREPHALRREARFLIRHRSAFLSQLRNRSEVLRAQFASIDVISYRPTFDDAAARARRFLRALPSG
jgi:predicted nucleotidyltransferase component of viral defense system